MSNKTEAAVEKRSVAWKNELFTRDHAMTINNLISLRPEGFRRGMIFRGSSWN